MAEEKKVTAAPAPQSGDHDRVAMLSIGKDGKPDQVAPEIIGDKEFALAATQEQFRQNAVSAVDQAKRSDLYPDAGASENLTQDPAIEEMQKAHESAEKSADAAAKSAVGNMFKD